MYDGLWDKWSHSLIPTPLNPLSPLFAVLDPYYMERAHFEDMPYVKSGPMFTEGTPWGAVLNPTIGALIKPEEDLHTIRFRHGVDILGVVKTANESIREYARDFTRTHYISVKGGQVSAVNWNSWNAPTPDIKVLSVNTTDSGLIRVNEGIYGVYGDGTRSYGTGSAGGAAGFFTYRAGLLGGIPGGGYEQVVAAGFNPFFDDTDFSSYHNKVPSLNERILARAEPVSFSEGLRMALTGSGNRYVRHGEIIANEKGELGIYQNRPIAKLGGDHFTLKDSLAIDAVTSRYTQDDKMFVLNTLNDKVPVSILKGLNEQLIQQSKQHIDSPYSVNEDLGFTTGEKLSTFNPSQSMELLDNADMVDDLMNQGNGSDFVRNATTSMRLIGGIYGYFGSELVGLGVHEEKIIANSSDMYAFNRRFWDLNLGGAGGAVSEIGRRFIPNYQRLTKVDPLLNEMPDWLPARFRTGNPFTKIPRGEMRLPGKGYETVNDLHPDQFSTEEDPYGAFDRFKILADIAPGTPEYKLWREIARKTVTDPELIEEMEEIKQRARQQGKKHDFYDYKIVGKDLDYRNVVVSEVLGYGKFRSGETIFKMAGITVQGNPDETAKEVLERYLQPGQTVTVAVDTNQAYARNKDAQKTLNAAVYVNGESVNQLMLESGDAKKRKSDKSAAATVENLSGLQYGIGLASEVIGHMDIPIISDQWLRIRSPYESYLAEQVYGTPYQSWAHPIDTFLYPAIERAVHEQSTKDLYLFDLMRNAQKHNQVALLDFTKFGLNMRLGKIDITRDSKNLIYMISILGNRSTLVGHALGNMLDAGNSKLAMPISSGLNLAITVAHMATGGTSMYNMGSLGAYMGAEFARFNEVSSAAKRTKYVAIGAIASMGYRLLRNSIFGEWTPSRQSKRHEMEEYWDRLNYIKWQGLYEEAARRAKEEEGVDVKRFLEDTEEKDDIRKATIKGLKKIKDSLNEAYGGKTNSVKNYLLKLINSRISELKPKEQMVEGGKYTQSAIIYKKAAEATMFGLKKGASWSSIISALPTNDREYFMEFVAETDQSKRDKILAVASPSLKKALQMSWGIKPDKQQSNEDFFEDHYLPDSDWKGWRPDVDLKDIEIKTVNNEAMNLSDFGFYESSLREPEVQEATPLPYNHENDDIRIGSEIKKLLKGKGLRNVEVDVSARNTMGATDIIANIAVWAGLKDQQRRVEDVAGAWI